MYDEDLVKPMRKQLTEIGFKELLTAEDVQSTLDQSTGSAMVVINSVCGCAAGGLRPAVKTALQIGVNVDNLLTVFAGQDKAATDKVRAYCTGYPPSSPSIAFFKNGKIVSMIERRDIEGHSPMQLAEKIRDQVSELA